jgi:hypothetical protein
MIAMTSCPRSGGGGGDGHFTFDSLSRPDDDLVVFAVDLVAALGVISSTTISAASTCLADLGPVAGQEAITPIGLHPRNCIVLSSDVRPPRAEPAGPRQEETRNMIGHIFTFGIQLQRTKK